MLPAPHRSRFRWRIRPHALSHKPRARPERSERLYLQHWRQSEVNNDVWQRCFMGPGEIATWLKSQSGERQWRGPLSQDARPISSHAVPLLLPGHGYRKCPFPANGLNPAWCPLSRSLSVQGSLQKLLERDRFIRLINISCRSKELSSKMHAGLYDKVKWENPDETNNVFWLITASVFPVSGLDECLTH